MQILEHLFLVGEYPERSRLLSGLTLEQVTMRPDGATHSIYEELWHVVAYQQSILEPNVPPGERFPQETPSHEAQWHALVARFLAGARAAAELEHSPERLAAQVSTGETLAEELQCVAIHNAYHLGKIVALRQRMGAWPPPGVASGS